MSTQQMHSQEFREHQEPTESIKLDSGQQLLLQQMTLLSQAMEGVLRPAIAHERTEDAMKYADNVLQLLTVDLRVRPELTKSKERFNLAMCKIVTANGARPTCPYSIALETKLRLVSAYLWT